MRLRAIIGLVTVFGLGILVGRGFGPSAVATAQDAKPANPYAEMLHVGIVVKDLDQAVARWRALGFEDIRVLPASKGVDRTYHGRPIDVSLKQAFIHGTRPMIELMEPVGDDPSPWGDYLKEHGEVLHHLAFRIPETGPELEKYRQLGLEEIAQGKWPEGESHWGTFHYVQDPKGGAVIEFISRVPKP
ncbi:MAG TPA: VOC family protein [Isosphaeraceae bacterium]|jgi:catechol 2,3-dioxygenase-like lactoylglutathione lyase family enzyme